MKKNKIGIIGGGNMGEAFIRGLQSKCEIYLCELNLGRVDFLKSKYKFSDEPDVSSLVSKVNIIILAVKPQEMESVLSQIKSSKDKLFISIAAGLTTKYFEERLGGQSRIVRAMPNLPAFIGKGVTGFCGGRFINDDSDMREAGGILEALGGAIPFKESEMDAVTAVSGSGPAYVFLFVEQWINAAVKLGLKEQEARGLVHKTLRGSVEFLKDSVSDVSGLRAKVTSKGGTTQAAMDVFSKGKFDQLIYKALLAAKKRAKELAK